jgi:regulator of sigma E protease
LDVLLTYILPFILILFGLIILHEAGHYFTAKLFGVKVLEAGIGIPPRLWGFRWRDTDYTINALPFGAFVRMLGEEDPSDPHSLAAAPKWKRSVILASGAGMNLVAAIVLFSVSLMVPRDVSAGGATISSVVPNSPAAHAGLKEGDIIEKINGRKAESVQDASYLVRLNRGENIDFTVRRRIANEGTQTIDVPNVYSRWNPPSYVDECGVKRGQGPTGITLGSQFGQNVPWTQQELVDLEKGARESFLKYRDDLGPDAPASCADGSEFFFEPVSAAECAALSDTDRAQAEARKNELFPNASAPCYDFDPDPAFEPFTRSRHEPVWEAVPHGARLAFESVIFTRNQIWMLIRGFHDTSSGGASVTGPVGIAQATGEIVNEAGWITLIDFAASISMALAIFNFLPIPMVDGGRLFFILIEILRGGRRVPPDKEALVHSVGFVLLIGAFLVITYFDVMRIVSGDSVLR